MEFALSCQYASSPYLVLRMLPITQINTPFGSGVMSETTGILFGNTMDDFGGPAKCVQLRVCVCAYWLGGDCAACAPVVAVGGYVSVCSGLCAIVRECREARGSLCTQHHHRHLPLCWLHTTTHRPPHAPAGKPLSPRTLQGPTTLLQAGARCQPCHRLSCHTRPRGAWWQWRVQVVGP